MTNSRRTSIPMILITGGLGAGKTTLSEPPPSAHEPARPKKLCLLINEFGQLGVDGRLVEAGEHPMFELNRGSLFCICIKTDFIATLREIADRVRPDLLVVEATGMAEPRDIQDFVDEPTLAAQFHIQDQPLSRRCLDLHPPRADAAGHPTAGNVGGRSDSQQDRYRQRD